MSKLMTPEIRLVRCPNCRNVLPELADVPVYKCGGCDIVLIAKNRKVDDATSLSECKESICSTRQAVPTSSRVCSSGPNDGTHKDRNHENQQSEYSVRKSGVSDEGCSIQESLICDINQSLVLNEDGSSGEFDPHVNMEVLPSELEGYSNVEITDTLPLRESSSRFLAPEERVRRDNLLKSSEVQQHGPNLFSISSTENRYTTDQTKDDQDGSFEPLGHDHIVRDLKRLERREDLSRHPVYCRRGSLDMYKHNNFSNDVFNEFERGASYRSVRKPVMMGEEDQARLLRMVRELQYEISKNGNERTGPDGSGRHGQGWLWSNRSTKSTRRSFLRETMNRRYDIDRSCSCCYPQDSKCSRHMVHPSHSGSYSSTVSSQKYKESEFTNWTHEDHSVKMYSKERQRVDKRYLRPITGGAPFVTCYSCLRPLQLPSEFFLLKKRCHLLKCGACSKVLQFSLTNKIHIVRYVPPRGDPPDVTSVSYSDDYSFFRKSFSTDGGPVVSRALSQNIQGMGDVRKMSYNSSKSKPEKVSSDNVSPARGSPLHQLMGYSSSSAVSRAC